MCTNINTRIHQYNSSHADSVVYTTQGQLLNQAFFDAMFRQLKTRDDQIDFSTQGGTEWTENQNISNWPSYLEFAHDCFGITDFNESQKCAD